MPGRCVSVRMGHGVSVRMEAMLTGRLLAESLRVGTDFRLPQWLRITRIGREDVAGSTSASQPDVWTLLDFAAPDERAEELGGMLAAWLTADEGWYADFVAGGEHVVVFP